jgi:heme/copper-type cytochrome/quinol oxidase subunit 2
MPLLADILFWAVVVIGLVAFVGFLALAATTGPKARRHPDGWRGSVRDDLIVLGPIAPFLIVVVIGAFEPPLRDETWWTGALFTIAGIGLLAQWLPVVRRARARTAAFERYPSQ